MRGVPVGSQTIGIVFRDAHPFDTGNAFYRLTLVDHFGTGDAVEATWRLLREVRLVRRHDAASIIFGIGRKERACTSHTDQAHVSATALNSLESYTLVEVPHRDHGATGPLGHIS